MPVIPFFKNTFYNFAYKFWPNLIFNYLMNNHFIKRECIF